MIVLIRIFDANAWRCIVQGFYDFIRIGCLPKIAKPILTRTLKETVSASHIFIHSSEGTIDTLPPRVSLSLSLCLLPFRFLFFSLFLSHSLTYTHKPFRWAMRTKWMQSP